ncbi:MAG: hypothetical protein P8Z35_18550 [Ignavibacteriaceae bacterium]|jgi:quinol monooxygenase YgiN
MSKVIFNIQYEVNPAKRDEYLGVVRELKNLLKSEGLESYAVYEVKGKQNHFQEVYTFSSPEAYEQFEDDQDERTNILINKLNDLTKDNSTKYTTLYEIVEN